jgi:hypothetical protein
MLPLSFLGKHSYLVDNLSPDCDLFPNVANLVVQSLYLFGF